MSGYAGAYLLRFDGKVPAHIHEAAWIILAVMLLARAGSFWFTGLFHGIMRYAGMPELKTIIVATTISTVLMVGAGVLIPKVMLPRSIYVGDWLLAILLAGSLRLAVRVVRERSRGEKDDKQNALLIGAGDVGEMFLRDVANNGSLRVVGILDDDDLKRGAVVRGARVMGKPDAETIRRVAAITRAKLAVLTMDAPGGSRVRDILTACREAGLETKTLPSLQQILSGDVAVSSLRSITIEDLLRREPVKLEQGSMERLLKGQRVLVTGGAGSIGSELCRQTLRFKPAAVGILDHNENAIFYLERELKERFPNADIIPLVGDVKDVERVREVLQTFQPHVVLHAAAHKHVPLMEQNPAEAIKNNVFGTCIMAEMSKAFGVERFVLVSTDKAVNPTSIMGASKRVAEMCVQATGDTGRTRFVAVRFGNVLGSAGSVVEIFRKQIEAGGPVTVTDPEMRRYFMTIPEACQLVLQAGALAEGGEIFILDMGEPVKVVDLAHDMIRMSGYEPNEDIPVVFMGKRPGEKLFEELMHTSEESMRKVHSKILVANIPATHEEQLSGVLERLRDSIDDPREVRRALAEIVPENQFTASEPPPPSQGNDVVARLQPLGTLRAPVPSTSS